MKKTNFGCIQSRLDRSINTENESLKGERALLVEKPYWWPFSRMNPSSPFVSFSFSTNSRVLDTNMATLKKLCK